MRRFIEVDELLEKLRDFRGVYLVEGKRDAEALKKIGLDEIIIIDGKKLEDVVEEVKNRANEVVILTDFDDEGRKKASKLIKLLVKNKIKVNRRLRREFRKLGIIKIEEIK